MKKSPGLPLPDVIEEYPEAGHSTITRFKAPECWKYLVLWGIRFRTWDGS